MVKGKFGANCKSPAVFRGGGGPRFIVAVFSGTFATDSVVIAIFEGMDKRGRKK